MNVMVVGCGSIGERHISNILNLYPDFDLMAMDISPDRGEYIKKTYNINVFDNLLDAFSTDVDIYLICTPPNTHISLALRSIENGAHVFIEKPLSHNTDSIDDLIKKAHEGSADNPLYVIAIGAISNVASALVKDPSIKEKVVVCLKSGPYSSCVYAISSADMRQANLTPGL